MYANDCYNASIPFNKNTPVLSPYDILNIINTTNEDKTNNRLRMEF